MKLLKPEWVHHDEKAIFSIDIHPDGSRFATGGLGNDSGRVVIWNLEPLVNEDAEKNKSIPKILCQLDNHLACVNSVRWSCNGSLLASGGDDKIIMIWKRSNGPSSVFGATGIIKASENWRTHNTLRGHSGDILDLAWSPRDRWLASCSVDNTVIVWDMHNLPAMVTILKGHTGLVKGVTWDPVGKFLASQSDDRSVRIWRTSDWGCQSTITEPFDDCGGTTHVLRLSWSPDGQYLVSAHAMNGGGPTAQIIERDGWKCDKDFVGHRKAVTCVRFHQSILKRQAPIKNKSQQYCCLAVGSRDRSLSVWLTALQRPVVVIYELFQDSILDLSWSTDRHILLACSTDGTVACIKFSEEELGTSLSEEEKNNLYQKIYGKSATVDLNDSHTGEDALIEYPDLIDINEKSQSKTENNLNNNNHNDNDIEMISAKDETIRMAPPPLLQTPSKAITQQKEMRMADGRRRITPIFIPIDQDGCESAPELSSSSRSTSNIGIAEKKMNEQMTKMSSSSSTLASSNIGTKLRTEDGISQSDDTNTLAIKIPVNNGQLDNRLTKAAPMKTNSVPKISKVQLQQQPQQQTDAAIPNPIPSMSRLNMLNVGKAVPFPQAVYKTLGDYHITAVNNNVTTSFGPLCKVNCTSVKNARNQLWEIFIGSPVVNFCLCAKYALFCSSDGNIRFVDIKNGVLVLPVLKLFTPAIQSVFSINSELGGVVTECGTIRIWNLTEQSIFITTTCNELLNAGSATSYVTHFHVTEAGIPFILLSNGCSFSYCKKLESWITLNSRDPIIRHGISTLPNNPIKNVKTYPLSSVQTTSHNFQPNVRNFQDLSNTAWQHAAKLSFIENQIKICESINSPAELEQWYSILGLHLAQHGQEKRIRLLLDDLLGASISFSFAAQTSERQKKTTILGIEKHKILSKVLEHIRVVPRWQRIYMEYNQQLENFNGNRHQMDMNGTNETIRDAA